MDEYRIQEAVEAWREELATEPEEGQGIAVVLMWRLTKEERDEAFARLGYSTALVASQAPSIVRRKFDAIVAQLGDVEVQD